MKRTRGSLEGVTEADMFCKECGASITISKVKWGAIFCSVKCRSSWRRKQPRRPTGMARGPKIVERTCAGCGRLFKVREVHVKRGGGKYCSRQCYANQQPKLVHSQCKQCGEQLKSCPSHIKLFCSRDCVAAFRFANRPVRVDVKANRERKKKRTMCKDGCTICDWLLVKRAVCAASKVDFNLDCEYIWQIMPKDFLCPIFGVKMIMRWEDGPKMLRATIDRIKPTVGYVKGNVAVMSFRANLMKGNHTTPAPFLKMAEWIKNNIANPP